jgi:hypothetical protein
MLSIHRNSAGQTTLGLECHSIRFRFLIGLLTISLGPLSACWGATSVVPDDECDALSTSGVDNANCPAHSFVCTADFSDFIVTHQGTPGDDITGSGHECNTCRMCNADPYGPPQVPQSCISTLSVTYTAEVSIDRSYSISSGTLSSAFLEAEAGTAFGNSAGTAVTFSAACGPPEHAPCTVQQIGILLSTIEGLTAEATVTYSWTATRDGYPSDPGYPTVTTSGLFYANGGTTTITATGTKAGLSRCDPGPVTACPDT